MSPTPFRSLFLAVLLPLCACGVPTPEEEAQEVGVSESALMIGDPGGTPKEDPCITECKKIADRWQRDRCIMQCIISNTR